MSGFVSVYVAIDGAKYRRETLLEIVQDVTKNPGNKYTVPAVTFFDLSSQGAVPLSTAHLSITIHDVPRLCAILGIDPPESKPDFEQLNQERAMRRLPQVFTHGTLVRFPCACGIGGQSGLASIIYHLNDHHNPLRLGGPIEDEPWTREKIADWLDELHDSGQVDLSIHWNEEHDDDSND